MKNLIDSTTNMQMCTQMPEIGIKTSKDLRVIKYKKMILTILNKRNEKPSQLGKKRIVENSYIRNEKDKHTGLL